MPKDFYFLVLVLKKFYPELLVEHHSTITNMLINQMKQGHIATIYYSLNSLSLINEKISIESSLFNKIKSFVQTFLNSRNTFSFNTIVAYKVAEFLNIPYDKENLKNNIKRLQDEKTDLVKFDENSSFSWEATSIIQEINSPVIKELFDKNKVFMTFEKSKKDGLIHTNESTSLSENFYAHLVLQKVNGNDSN